MTEELNITDFNEDDILAFESASSEERLVKASKFKQAVDEVLDCLVKNAFANSVDPQNLRIYTDLNLDASSTYNQAVFILGQNHEQEEGVDCKVFRLGSTGWQKGKVKLSFSLNFIPDESEPEKLLSVGQSESPLDDIRQMLNEAS